MNLKKLICKFFRWKLHNNVYIAIVYMNIKKVDYKCGKNVCNFWVIFFAFSGRTDISLNAFVEQYYICFKSAFIHFEVFFFDIYVPENITSSF